MVHPPNERLDYIEITEKCHIVLYTYSEICLEIPYTAS